MYEIFASVAAVAFMPNGTLFPVTLVALYTQLVGGDPVDVSLNTIVNGATPDQLLSDPVAVDMGVAVKDATGAELTFTHVTCSDMFVPYAFVAFSLMV